MGDLSAGRQARLQSKVGQGFPRQPMGMSHSRGSRVCGVSCRGVSCQGGRPCQHWRGLTRCCYMTPRYLPSSPLEACLYIHFLDSFLFSLTMRLPTSYAGPRPDPITVSVCLYATGLHVSATHILYFQHFLVTESFQFTPITRLRYSLEPVSDPASKVKGHPCRTVFKNLICLFGFHHKWNRKIGSSLGESQNELLPFHCQRRLQTAV